MSIIPPLVACDPQKLIYNVSERAILDPFKREYISLPTPTVRRQFFLSRIWPSMYRYWHEKEGPLDAGDWNERSKTLSEWMHNNWRLPHRGGKVKGVLTVRKADVIWNTRQKDVWVEISQILQVPEANTTTPKWFQTRTIAIQNILSRMDKNEMAKLDEQVRDIEENGYSEDQKRAYAEKYCTRRMDTSSKSHWLEMGLLTLSVIAYRRTDGKLAVEIHENASSHIGVTERSFDDEYDGKAREIRRVWLDYVRNMLEEKAGGPTPSGAPDSVGLRTSPDGFPLFPQGFAWENLKKKQCEKVLREYLKQNYLLATGRQSEDVPYKDMAKSAGDRRRFIDDQYLPRGFALRDPHNLKVEEAQKLIKFLIDRQASHDPAQVFRFHTFKLSRKGSETNPTIYPDEIDPENPPVLNKKVKRPPRTKSNPPEASRDAEGTAGAHARGIPGTVSQLRLDDPNLFTMTPTPEPPDRATPGLAQGSITPHVEDRTTQYLPAPAEEPDGASVNVIHGANGNSTNGIYGAGDFDSTYGAGTFDGTNQTNNGAIVPGFQWGDANLFAAQRITPGPHQMLIGDWTTQLLGNVQNIGIGAPNYDGNYDFGGPYTQFQDFGVPQTIGVNGYEAAADGIDYGVLLNMPGDSSNTDLGAHAHNQRGYTTPDNVGNPASEYLAQPQVMQKDTTALMRNNQRMTPVTDSTQQRLPQHASATGQGTVQMNPRGAGESTQNTADRLPVGSGAQPAGGNVLTRGGVSGEDSGKGKRTADDLAAEEARGMAVPAKRQRRRRVRES